MNVERQRLSVSLRPAEKHFLRTVRRHPSVDVGSFHASYISPQNLTQIRYYTLHITQNNVFLFLTLSDN